MPPRKINLVEAADQKITKVFDPHIAGDVNDSQAKVAKFGEAFDWHAHEHEDEAFLVLRGQASPSISATVRSSSARAISSSCRRGVEHRPRSLTAEPVVLMFEPATTLNTGNAKSDLTVSDLKRL